MDSVAGVGSEGVEVEDEKYESVKAYRSMPIEDTYENRDLETAYRNLSSSYFNQRVIPGCKINQNVGNCYTGSVFASLLSVVNDQGALLDGKRVMMFSYGSGSLASIYRCGVYTFSVLYILYYSGNLHLFVCDVFCSVIHCIL